RRLRLLVRPARPAARVARSPARARACGRPRQRPGAGGRARHRRGPRTGLRGRRPRAPRRDRLDRQHRRTGVFAPARRRRRRVDAGVRRGARPGAVRLAGRARRAPRHRATAPGRTARKRPGTRRGGLRRRRRIAGQAAKFQRGFTQFSACLRLSQYCNAGALICKHFPQACSFPMIKKNLLAPAILLALATPAVHAAVPVGEIAATEVSFEGLLQTDGYWYDFDASSIDGDASDGRDTDFGLRRAELVLKGKGPGDFDWAVGYDASGDGKFLDVFGRYKLGNGFIQAGQYKQPIGLEELSSTKNNDFIAKSLVTNTFAVSRRLGVAGGYGGDDWGVTGSVFGRELTRDRA